MTPTEQLLARVAIEALNAEFAYRVDHQAGHGVADLFTPDGWYGRESGERSVGTAAIDAAYAGRRSRGARTARHLFTNLRLRFAGERRAEGTVIMLLFAEDGTPPLPAVPLAVSDFDDVYVCGDDGQWRYASRSIRSLFRDAGGRPVVLPLGAATEVA